MKFEGINHETENCEDMGDNVLFLMGPNLEGEPAGLQNYEINPGTTAGGGIAERDASGNIIKDVLYSETVLYGRGGVEYSIAASGNWLVKKEGQVSARVVVEKLEDPVYPMMKVFHPLHRI